MKTPIFDFVKGYENAHVTRFHMPGHKGKSFLGCEPLDVTEIMGADVLYSPDGIIAESENNASALFGTAHSFYSAEGSSLSIKAMLALVTIDRTAEERPLIVAARNAHKAFVYACALLDLDVQWLYPAKGSPLCSCVLTPEDVKNALTGAKTKPKAVYLTSPDYLGQICDIEGIASVCHQYGIPLLVDNAHGAYLKFLTPSGHPMDLGADLCCDSAHKTLPVLTGGGYLHISRNTDPSYLQNARKMLSVFASTSPSYLILQSLDLCNAYLEDGYPEKLRTCVEKINSVKQKAAALGLSVVDSEPLKMVLNANASGYTGEELANFLRKYRIEAEFADLSHLVLMITPENTDDDLWRLTEALEALPQKAPLFFEIPSVFPHRMCEKSIREAIFASQENLPFEKSLGRVCAAPTVSCPPAIPIVMSGERITKEDVELLRFYGINTIAVVKE